MKCRLRVLTPLCVRSGETASVLSDYIVDHTKRLFYFIDHHKLEQWLVSQGNNLRPLVRELRAIGLSGRGNLGNFFQDHRLNPSDYARAVLPGSYSATTTFNSRDLYLPTTSADRAYLPGSTLKGAFRTALMHYYLKKEKKLKEGQGVESLLDQVKPPYTGENIFRSNPRQVGEDALRFLQLSDSSPVPFQDLAVYILARVGTRDTSIPVLMAGLQPGTELEFDLRIRPQEARDPLSPFWKDLFQKGEHYLLQALWIWSRAQLAKEMELLKQHVGKIAFKQLLSAYNRFLMANKLAINCGAVPIRIGFGKTYFFNSIGYFLSAKEMSRLRVNVFRGKTIQSFPSTRWAVQSVDNSWLPAGWCLLIPENQPEKDKPHA